MARFSEKRLRKALKNAPMLIRAVEKAFADGIDEMGDDLRILVEAAERYEGLVK